MFSDYPHTKIKIIEVQICNTHVWLSTCIIKILILLKSEKQGE